MLPLQPESHIDFNGVGLALHFLLGNTIVLHTGLTEFWAERKAEVRQEDIEAAKQKVLNRLENAL